MPYLDPKKIGTMRKNLHDYSEERREIIKLSGDALHLSKRVIFALHRDNSGEAREKLTGAEKIFEEINSRFRKKAGLLSEGSYSAALEEYVEAKLFFSFVEKNKISFDAKLAVADDIFLAGLCDVPGELYRYALRAATARNFLTVQKCADASEEIIGALIDFNLTSYLRTKYDQAKQAGQKLEQVVYEISLCNRSPDRERP